MKQPDYVVQLKKWLDGEYVEPYVFLQSVEHAIEVLNEKEQHLQDSLLNRKVQLERETYGTYNHGFVAGQVNAMEKAVNYWMTKNDDEGEIEDDPKLDNKREGME